MDFVGVQVGRQKGTKLCDWKPNYHEAYYHSIVVALLKTYAAPIIDFVRVSDEENRDIYAHKYLNFLQTSIGNATHQAKSIRAVYHCDQFQ